jgi:C1A family cysteine protease
MKKANIVRIVWILLIAAIAVFLLAQSPRREFDEDEFIAQVQRLIEERGYSWTAGKTSVSGLSPEEKKKLLGAVQPPEDVYASLPAFQALGDTIEWDYFNWRDYDAITPITHQGPCGSCWAFAAVAELESNMLIYDQRFADLSEQQVMSCNVYGSGCSGGWSEAAYLLFMSYGSVSEGCMPYEADDTVPCREDMCTPLGKIVGYESVQNSVNIIKQALMRGPVWTTFTVDDPFYAYESGCLEYNATGPINHAVIIIGWDDNECFGEGAWICKNSWGENWGDSGFFKIKYGDSKIGQNSTQLIYEPSRTLVHLDNPNDGGQFSPGQQVDIVWTIARETPDSVKVFLGSDDGFFDEDLLFASTAGEDSFLWTVPDINMTDARISVYAYVAGEVTGMDFSDNTYNISEDVAVPWVGLFYPNGGESFIGGEEIDISWIALDNVNVDSLSIFYSSNGGQDYELITSGEPNDSLYQWTVPQVDSDSCKVMIVAYDPGMNSNYDASDGLFSITILTGVEVETPRYDDRLEQNFPNPFNGTTTIAYSVGRKGFVDIRIYDAAGRLVDIVERREREPGSYQTIWRGTDRKGNPVTSGIYFCRITAGEFSKSIKINYLR